MKKIYEKIKMEIVVFCEEDIVRTSPNQESTDNIESMPEFPEFFG